MNPKKNMRKQKSSFGQSDIVRLSDEDAATELLERAVTGLWDVVNDLTRFRRTTRVSRACSPWRVLSGGTRIHFILR